MNSFFDLHVHISPDIVLRKYNLYNINKVLPTTHSGIVLKSHVYNTVKLANHLRKQGYPIYGSLVLNKYIGGLNINTIKTTIKNSYQHEPFILYFPTFSYNYWITNLEKKTTKTFKNNIFLETISYNGHLKKNVIDIIKLASYHNIPIATGHSNKNEVLLLCEEVEKNNGTLLLTHPCHPFIGFTINELNIILNSSSNIYIEITLLMLLNKKQSFENLYKLLSICNNNKICISSDLGQIDNISPSTGYKWFNDNLNNYFNDIQFSKTLFKKLCWLNPMKLLGLRGKFYDC